MASRQPAWAGHPLLLSSELHQRRGIRGRRRFGRLPRKTIVSYPCDLIAYSPGNVAHTYTRTRAHKCGRAGRAFVCTRLPNPDEPGPLTFSPLDRIIDFGEGRGAKARATQNAKPLWSACSPPRK